MSEDKISTKQWPVSRACTWDGKPIIHPRNLGSGFEPHWRPPTG